MYNQFDDASPEAEVPEGEDEPWPLWVWIAIGISALVLIVTVVVVCVCCFRKKKGSAGSDAADTHRAGGGDGGVDDDGNYQDGSSCMSSCTSVLPEWMGTKTLVAMGTVVTAAIGGLTWWFWPRKPEEEKNFAGKYLEGTKNAAEWAAENPGKTNLIGGTAIVGTVAATVLATRYAKCPAVLKKLRDKISGGAGTPAADAEAGEDAEGAEDGKSSCSLNPFSWCAGKSESQEESGGNPQGVTNTQGDAGQSAGVTGRGASPNSQLSPKHEWPLPQNQALYVELWEYLMQKTWSKDTLPNPPAGYHWETREVSFLKDAVGDNPRMSMSKSRQARQAVWGPLTRRSP